MSAAILTSIILSLLTVVLFYQAQKKITIPVTQKQEYKRQQRQFIWRC